MGLRRLDLRGFSGDRRELADRLPRPVDEQVRSSDAVAAILADVRTNGDEALLRLTATFDNGTCACEEHWAKGHAIWLPYWFLCIITAVSPAVWWLRKPARGQPGRCETCGYDLRATPNRCPECGNAPSKK